jgi:hypothetical protein
LGYFFKMRQRAILGYFFDEATQGVVEIRMLCDNIFIP